MKKIKLFKHVSRIHMEEAINDFIEEHPHIIDIKFQAGDDFYSAMIIYEEQIKTLSNNTFGGIDIYET